MSDTYLNKPVVELSSGLLHFIWIVDCSGSMKYNGKIQQINDAIRSSIPAMKNVAKDNPNTKLLVRAVSFSNHANWHIGKPTEIENFQWNDLNADGLTAMGEALQLVANELSVEKLTQRGFPPVLVLVTDGVPTDEFEDGLKALFDTPWGKKAIKIAIAIGNDTEPEILRKFIDDPTRTPLKAINAEMLVYFINWASTEVLKAASQ